LGSPRRRRQPDLPAPAEDLIGTEGDGFRAIVHGMNPERVLAAAGVGFGHAALTRPAGYAHERVVFDRPIGRNQGVQHPLAERWAELEAARLLVMRRPGATARACPAGRRRTPQSTSPARRASAPATWRC
jgi:acyl-CoA dehydrogenase